MKYAGIVTGFFLYTLYATLYTQVAYAHLAGQPPFFKINGEYALLYPVPLTSLSDFPLPQDLAPARYLINESISFELDIKRLPAPPQVVEKTKFNWDFGDNTSAHGLLAKHTYSKMGSYILKIYADDSTTPSPQLLESALINIVPAQDYPLPKAIILVDGKESTDPLTDILSFPFGKNIHFDAGKSYSKNAKIISYFWDFGDQTSSQEKETDHYYPKDLTQTFPLLRIKDSNGFISDNFIELQNENNGKPLGGKISPSVSKGAKTPSQLPQTIVIGIVIAIAISITIARARARLFARGHGRGKLR